MKYLCVVFQLCYLLPAIFINPRQSQTPRITGAKDAVTGEFPFVVLHIAHISNETAYAGVGSLIAADWVLTAAHSLPENYRSAEVFAGSEKWKEYEQRRKVRVCLRHQDFRVQGPGFVNDIGLIKLVKGFDLESPNVGLATLSAGDWPSSELTPGTCQTVGYEYKPPDTSTLDVLKSAEVSAKYGRNACGCILEEHHESMVCLERVGNGSPCHTFVGGPLLCDAKLVAVFSFKARKDACNRTEPDQENAECLPGNMVEAYTFVDHYSDWIKDEMRQISSSDRPEPVFTNYQAISAIIIYTLVSCYNSF